VWRLCCFCWSGSSVLQCGFKLVSFLRTYIQGDQKVSLHLMITIQKVTSNIQNVPASLQTFIDTPNCVLEDRQGQGGH
jgi:hypothetical protein